jgi:hypothetical protein
VTRVAEHLHVAQTALGMQTRQLKKDLVLRSWCGPREALSRQSRAASCMRAPAILKTVEETRHEVSTRDREENGAVQGSPFWNKRRCEGFSSTKVGGSRRLLFVAASRLPLDCVGNCSGTTIAAKRVHPNATGRTVLPERVVQQPQSPTGSIKTGVVGPSGTSSQGHTARHAVGTRWFV